MKGFCFRVHVWNPRGSAKPPRTKAPHCGVRQGRAAKVAAISQVDSRHVFKYSCVLCTIILRFFFPRKQLRKIYEANVAAKAKTRWEIPELNGGLNETIRGFSNAVVDYWKVSIIFISYLLYPNYPPVN